jgi:hypothetical protein
LSAVETENGPWTQDQVDKLVEKLFYPKRPAKKLTCNLHDNIGQATTQDRRRLLTLYRQVYKGKSVPEDDRSLDQNQLKLFGLVRVEIIHSRCATRFTGVFLTRSGSWRTGRLTGLG